MNERLDDPAFVYRKRGRPGLEQADVDRAADALLRDGVRPSVERVRARVGGSPNTIGPLLDKWWARLAGRLDSGSNALARLPESLAMAAEALFIRALDAARERADQEQTRTRETLAHDQQLLEARRHALTLREGELEARLAERERIVAILEQSARYERGERRKLETAYQQVEQRLHELERKTVARRRVPPKKRERVRKQRSVASPRKKARARRRSRG